MNADTHTAAAAIVDGGGKCRSVMRASGETATHTAAQSLDPGGVRTENIRDAGIWKDG